MAANLKLEMLMQYDNTSRKRKEALPAERPTGQRQWSPDVYRTSRGHRSVGGDDRFTCRPLQLNSCSPPYEEGRSPYRRQWDHDVYKSRSPIYQRSSPGEFVEAIFISNMVIFLCMFWLQKSESK